MWSGHSLIESGTFRKKEYAGLIRSGDQMSPGFIHPPAEPGQDRTYHNIRIFERSVTPRGRAANPHTLITVKENNMGAIAPEKLAEFQERGGDPALLESLVSELETKEKALESSTTFKADDESAQDEQPEEETLDTEVETWPDDEAEEKAAKPMAVEGESEDDEPEDDGEEMYVGDMFPEELGAVIEEKLAPILKAISDSMAIGQKVEELKGLMGGYIAKKDDEAARLREQLDGINQRLKELEGDQPASTGYRASQSATPVPERLKEVPAPQAAPVLTFFDAITRPRSGLMEE